MKVREVLRLLRDDGWLVVATRGSHVQLKHATKRGRVTVAGRPNDDLAPGTLKSILEQSEAEGAPMRRFLIVVEKAASNFSAYSPDLPGCVATGATVQETKTNMRAAIDMHVQGLREDRLPIPEPSAVAEYVEVAS